MFKFSKSSIERLNTVYGPLQALVYAVLANSKYDFGIPQYGGKRTIEEQKMLYAQKKSKADGEKIKSYHQDGYAIDIAIFENGIYSNDVNKYEEMSKIFFMYFKKLQELGVFQSNMYLRWGGDFNMNNIRADKDNTESFLDAPHFEIRIK